MASLKITKTNLERGVKLEASRYTGTVLASAELRFHRGCCVVASLECPPPYRREFAAAIVSAARKRRNNKLVSLYVPDDLVNTYRNCGFIIVHRQEGWSIMARPLEKTRRSPQKRLPPDAEPDPGATLTCLTCGETKPLDEMRKRKPGLWERTCKACRRQCDRDRKARDRKQAIRELSAAFGSDNLTRIEQVVTRVVRDLGGWTKVFRELKDRATKDPKLLLGLVRVAALMHASATRNRA